MSVFKFSALAFGAGMALFAGVGSASAQGLSPFGMWGEPPERSSRPSYLGAAPAAPSVAKSAAALAQGGARPTIAPRAPQIVAFPNGFEPGSIVIDHASRKLYYTQSRSTAYVYPVAVGKQGFAWTGVEQVSRIEDWPDWHPPAEMRQRQPSLPVRMTGGLRNPLGAKAIYLGNTLYRIHGTNDSKSIGSAASSGCFRMHNAHVVHLAQHVDAATVVYVMKRLPKSGPAMPPPGYAPVIKQAPSVQTTAGDAPADAPETQPATPEAPQNAPAGDSGQAPDQRI